MLGKRRRRCANIETVLGKWHVFAGIRAVTKLVYSRPSVGVVLGQRRRQIVGSEIAMGYGIGPTLNRNWVGRPTSCLL